jgi:hypothetical protein
MDEHSHLLGINYLDDRCSVTKTRGENLYGCFPDSFRGRLLVNCQDYVFLEPQSLGGARTSLCFVKLSGLLRTRRSSEPFAPTLGL